MNQVFVLQVEDAFAVDALAALEKDWLAFEGHSVSQQGGLPQAHAAALSYPPSSSPTATQQVRPISACCSFSMSW